MTCKGEVDLHTDSGYRRVNGDNDEVKGQGMRGMNVIRRGTRLDGKGGAVHLLESICKSHRLQIRSSYGAEMIAAANGYDDAYPVLVTLHELREGVLPAEQLARIREEGGLCLVITLTTDAESCYKSLTSRDLKIPSEKTLLGHVKWIRQHLQTGLITSIQWCDTRDMTADGHTKGSVDRRLLLLLMRGQQTFQHDIKKYTPRFGNNSTRTRKVGF